MKEDEDADLALVEALLTLTAPARYQRFTKQETRAGIETPDYRIMEDKTLAAYCEVKSPRNDKLDDMLEGAPAFQPVGYAGKDSTFNRVGRQIVKAASQFESVNQSHDVPNVLVIVNHADASRISDLDETLTGEFNGIPTVKNVSEGEVAKARGSIDAYVWIDARSRRVAGWRFNPASRLRLDVVFRLFNIDPRSRQCPC